MSLHLDLVSIFLLILGKGSRLLLPMLLLLSYANTVFWRSHCKIHGYNMKQQHRSIYFSHWTIAVKKFTVGLFVLLFTEKKENKIFLIYEEILCCYYLCWRHKKHSKQRRANEYLCSSEEFFPSQGLWIWPHSRMRQLRGGTTQGQAQVKGHDVAYTYIQTDQKSRLFPFT